MTDRYKAIIERAGAEFRAVTRGPMPCVQFRDPASDVLMELQTSMIDACDDAVALVKMRIATARKNVASEYLREIGRKGGTAKSVAKTAAARRNAKLTCRAARKRRKK